MEFLKYILNPEKVVKQFNKKFSFKKIFIDFILIGVFIIIITFLSGTIISYFNLEVTHIRFPEKTISFFITAVVLAPFLEEFLFRAALKRTKYYLFCFWVGYLFLLGSFLYENYSFYDVIGFLLLTLSLYLVHKYRTYFKLSFLIYLSSLAFGLIHLQNLDFDYSSNFGALLYIIPIFFGGLVLSFIRLKYSLLAAILFHSFHNLIAYIIFFII